MNRVPFELTCFACGCQLVAAKDMTLDRPEPQDGDPTICGNCGAIGQFMGDPVHSVARMPDSFLSIIRQKSPKTYSYLIARSMAIQARGPLPLKDPAP